MLATNQFKLICRSDCCSSLEAYLCQFLLFGVLWCQGPNTDELSKPESPLIWRKLIHVDLILFDSRESWTLLRPIGIREWRELCWGIHAPRNVRHKETVTTHCKHSPKHFLTFPTIYELILFQICCQRPETPNLLSSCQTSGQLPGRALLSNWRYCPIRCLEKEGVWRDEGCWGHTPASPARRSTSKNLSTLAKFARCMGRVGSSGRLLGEGSQSRMAGPGDRTSDKPSVTNQCTIA